MNKYNFNEDLFCKIFLNYKMLLEKQKKLVLTQSFM